MVQIKIVPSQPALVLEGIKKHLVVTDLHIGFEGILEKNNVFFGKNNTINETIAEISSLIESEKPNSLILLGDVKSSIKSISKNEWDQVPLFFEKLKQKVDIILVPGNHDSDIQKLVPDDITMISSSGLVIDNTLLTHGHVLPSENFAHVDRIIMGHIHPVFFQKDSVINGQRVWISINAQKESIFPSSSGKLEISIIPSFNKYFYATHRRQYKKSISPIIEKIKNETISAKILTLDGTIIGNESMINQLL